MDDLATDDVQGVARKYRFAGPETVKDLVRALHSDARPRVRANAVTALLDNAVHGGRQDEARPHLLRALADPDPDVEARAAAALAGWYRDEPGVRETLAAHAESLRRASASKDGIVQTHAILALETMGLRPPAAAILAAASPADRRRGIEQAARDRDGAAVPALVRLANDDPDVIVRAEAIPVAARLAAPDIRDAFLARIIDGPVDTLAGVAIRAAGETGAEALAPRLRKILEATGGRSSPRIEAAIDALHAFGDKSAVPLIAAHLADPSPETIWRGKLALDTLVGPAREAPEWRAWARRQGYLGEGGPF